ncbi:MAG: endopeptidase La [Chromatiales bacterium]|nr:endopeptidase La [Chromatiales bacterium]
MNDPTANPPATDRAETKPRDDVLILLPVRNTVLFPEMVMPLAVGRPRSVAAAQEAARHQKQIGIIMQRDPQLDEPGADDLHRIGTVANILRYLTTEEGQHHLVCQGVQRFRIVEFVQDQPFLAARVEYLEEPVASGAAIDARLLTLRERALEALSLLPQTPQELVNTVGNIDLPGVLADVIAGYMDIRPEEKQQVLEALDIGERMDAVQKFLDYRVEVLKLSQKISQRTQESMQERQREAMLREQMRSIQQELGEADEKAEEIRTLGEAIEKAGMPEEVKAHTERELKRLERMSEASGEFSMARTYLDWLIDVPWSKLSEDKLDIEAARRVLDEDHYDLDKVKRRILEHLAVHKLNPQGKSPILCFVGPPGVGKTSLGQSIARAMGREFVRASLGGVHDEAEIRGHRRTYIGALPGNVVQGLRKAGTRNPVFMLDEMDKLGSSFHGDPSAALLEVLDPEQNASFRDNYLGVPLDLSQVMFIGTANLLDSIPGPLRDRMEVIELPGYTREDKIEIARRYLIDRQLDAAGIKPGQCTLTDAALERIVADYTREAGCRNLERQIGAVVRNVAVRIAEGRIDGARIDAEDVPTILGAPKFENEPAMRVSVPGVATGLAWTPVGGDILFVEATRTPGKGGLILTGQLGDVMKESAQAALTLIKANATRLGLDPAGFEKQDIHIHVPAGAIPKDGPSAGVALYTTLVSLLTDRCVRPDVAMTGEITLRGLVLPVGGIKEKVLAALAAGIRTVLLPARNRKDLEDIPAKARERLDIHFVERVDEAEALALSSAARETEQAANP